MNIKKFALVFLMVGTLAAGLGQLTVAAPFYEDCPEFHCSEYFMWDCSPYYSISNYPVSSCNLNGTRPLYSVTGCEEVVSCYLNPEDLDNPEL